LQAFDSEKVTLVDIASGPLLHVIGPSLSSLREIAETAAAIGGGVKCHRGRLHRVGKG
jgi:hypothetical protein